MKEVKPSIVGRILLSPWTVALGILSGVMLGIYHPSLAPVLKPYGEVFLSLLQMCVIPILTCAIVLSMGRLMSAEGGMGFIRKILGIFLSGMIFAALLGLGMSYFSGAGENLPQSAKRTLGKLVVENELSEDAIATSGRSQGVAVFLTEMIPANIFQAASKGQNLAVLFFSLLLGIALGVVGKNSREPALRVVEALYDSFLKIISWILYALPFGLCCMFAVQVGQVGVEVLQALLKFVVLCYAAAGIMLAVYSVLIWRKLGGPYLSTLRALRETMVVAFGTSSSFAALPSALRCVHEHCKIGRSITDLILPLGVNLNPQGITLHFALASVFVAQVYGISFGASEYAYAAFACIFASMAAAGAPGIAGLTMLSLVLEPLGLPAGAAIVLLVAIDPIIDPILTVVTIYSNCFAAISVGKDAPIEMSLNKAETEIYEVDTEITPTSLQGLDSDVTTRAQSSLPQSSL